ncbi:toxin VasX [Psychrobacter glacincola]|uniref:toxin VasX n=2 Tax=Moraxellaceae TaxID=468 RepID=UPI003FD54442
MGILDSIFGAEEQIESTGVGTNDSMCQDCKNEGVAILPIVGRKMLSTDNRTNQQHRVGEDVNLNTQRQKITQGFIYVYYEDKNLWEGFQADKNSCIRRINLDSTPDLEARDFGCNVSGHNDKLKFITLNPKYGSNVWIAYSIYPWTKNVRKKYAKEGYKTDKLTKSENEMRADRMMHLNLSQTHVSSLSNSDDYNVLELNRSQQILISNKGLNLFYESLNIEVDNYYIKELESLNSQNGDNKIDKTIFEQMKLVNKEGNPNLIIFEDPVGDLAILNSQRNYCVDAIAAIQNADLYNKEVIGNPSLSDFEYKIVLAKVIDGIITEAGIVGTKYERRLKLTEFKSYKEILSSIENLQKNYLFFDAIMVERLQDQNSVWKYIQAYDFDADSVDSIIHHRDMVLSNFLGAGSADFYEACGMGGNSSSGLDVEVGDWIINTLCNLQPDLVSLIQNQSQGNVNTDRLYDTLKGDVQVSLTLLAEHLEKNEGKFGQLFNKLRGNRLSQDTATAISVLVSNSYQTILTSQRKRGHGNTPKAQVQAITIAMQNFLLSNHGEIAIPVTMQGRIKAFYENLTQFSKESSEAKNIRFTDDIVGDRLGRKSVDTQNLRGRHGVISQTESFHTFTLMVSVQLKNGALPNAKTLRAMDELTKRPILKLVNDKVLKDAIDSLNSKVSTMSSTAGIVLSGGLMLFQSRAMLSNLEKMGTDKSLSENAELGTAAMGATMMVASASIELAANITQFSAVTQELKMKAASRSLRAATIGMYAGWIEVGYLLIYKQNNDISWGIINSNIIGVAAFSLAGRALAEVMAKKTGARLSVMIVLSEVGGIALFANPYFLAAVMIIGLGTSLWSYYKMAVYDDSPKNLTNIDYWLDFGVFGKRELLSDEYTKDNPFRNTSSFTSADDEVSALALVLKKQTIKITVDNGITTNSTIKITIESYLPLHEKDNIKYEILKLYHSNYSRDYLSSEPKIMKDEKEDETTKGLLQLKDLLKPESREEVFSGIIGKSSAPKPQLAEGLYRYHYQQSKGGYILVLEFVSHDAEFAVSAIGFSMTTITNSGIHEYTSSLTETQQFHKNEYDRFNSISI